MINCKHYFGRVVKNVDGIPIDYEYGCFAGQDLTKCGEQCPYYNKDMEYEKV